MGFFDRLKGGLAKTKNAVFGQVDNILKSFVKVDEDLLEELEEALICADLGFETTEEVMDELREAVRDGRLKEASQVKDALKGILREKVGEGTPLTLDTTPSVILIIGVNGVGKTTSIGKIAANLKSQGKNVVVAAADTFRAAAIDQLEVWTERAGVEIIRQNEGSDPAAVVFDAAAAAKKRNADVLIIDTAGRLHNKKNLMEELKKIYRVIDRELPYSDREVLLVLDATTGQNAVNQAREFMNAAEITGIVLTKLDGTARGGVVLAIKNELKIPVKFIGVGEGIDDLQPFNPKMFADSLFDELPESYKEKENEVLPVYEQPLEKVEITERLEAEEALKEIFESFVENSEDDGYGSVSDGDNQCEDAPAGECAQGDSTAVQSGVQGLEQKQENTAAESEEIETVTQSTASSDSSEDSEIDSLYGSLDKFYL